MSGERLIVIGASAGGLAALADIVAALPADLPAPICLVQHIGTHRSFLPKLLRGRGRLPAVHPVDGQSLLAGHIYVAPPDMHMQVDMGAIRLNRGPKEHHTRPAVDPLFRSAALAYGDGVIGVVLTGYLNDGTVGLQAIKEQGGIAVVQDPEDAEVPGMPQSALQHVPVDYCLPARAIGRLIATLVSEPRTTVPVDLSTRVAHEEAVFKGQGDIMAHLRAVASPSTFSCPDCNGTLWEQTDVRPLRFRCHTGHAFTLDTLQHTQSLATDEALWSAVRSLQEKAALLREQAGIHREEADEQAARACEDKAARAQAQTLALRQILDSVDEADD
jgi:two-component system chemotaxis response regulator CheB